MELIPFTPELAGIWREAVDRSIISPSPLGGPEYSATMRMSWGQTYLFKSGNVLVPMVKGETRVAAIIRSRVYTGLRFNSLLYPQKTEINLPEILDQLPQGCFLKLHIPEEIYISNRELFLEHGFETDDSYEYYKVILPDSYQEWYNYPRVSRSNINRAIDSGVKVKIGGVEFLDRFYELFLKSFSRWKSQGQAKQPHRLDRFRRIFELPDNNSKIALSFHEDQPIAGVIFCHYNHTAGAFHAGMDFKYQNLRAADLVQSEIIRFLIERGIAEYNLGGTIGSEKLGRFKKKLGAQIFKSYLLGRHRFPRLYSLLGKRAQTEAVNT